MLRRSQARRSGRVLRAGPLQIDTAGRDVRVGERRLNLPAKEYELLVALATEPHRVFTREELLRVGVGLSLAWAARARSTATPRACGASSATGAREKLVVNVWGVGYRLCDPPAAR